MCHNINKVNTNRSSYLVFPFSKSQDYDLEPPVWGFRRTWLIGTDRDQGGQDGRGQD